MPEQPSAARDALVALAAALELEASESDVERSLPLIARVLTHALGDTEIYELGEIEPAFGLQFAAASAETEDSNGSS